MQPPPCTLPRKYRGREKRRKGTEMCNQVEAKLESEKPTDAGSLVVELMVLRQRMVRDLEQFLSVELSGPAAWIRWVPRVGRVQNAPQAGPLTVGEACGVRLGSSDSFRPFGV